MQVETSRGSVLVRFGRRFGPEEAERLEETVVAFSPVSQLVIDFSAVHQFEDAAVIPLARTIRARPGIRLSLRGLTLHHIRLLRYFGVEQHAGEAGQVARPIATA